MGIFNRSYSIKDLLQLDEGRIKRSSVLKVKLVNNYSVIKQESIFSKLLNIFRNKPKSMLYKILKYEVASDSGHKYTVLLEVRPSFDPKRFLENKVRVFCSCPDFKYRVAYYLNKHDGVLLIKSTETHLGIALSEVPTRRDLTPACKHLYAVFMEFKTNYKSYGIELGY